MMKLKKPILDKNRILVSRADSFYPLHYRDIFRFRAGSGTNFRTITRKRHTFKAS